MWGDALIHSHIFQHEKIIITQGWTSAELVCLLYIHGNCSLSNIYSELKYWVSRETTTDVNGRKSPSIKIVQEHNSASEHSKGESLRHVLFIPFYTGDSRHTKHNLRFARLLKWQRDLSVRPWAGYVTCLCLNFSICKIEIITIPSTSHGG